MKCEPAEAARIGRVRFIAVALLAASSAACAEPSAPQVTSAADSSGGVAMTQASQQGPVSNLSFSQGQSFATLAEYLEFRRRRGEYDVPWYREIKPGTYELVSSADRVRSAKSTLARSWRGSMAFRAERISSSAPWG